MALLDYVKEKVKECNEKGSFADLDIGFDVDLNIEKYASDFVVVLEVIVMREWLDPMWWDSAQREIESWFDGEDQYEINIYEHSGEIEIYVNFDREIKKLYDEAFKLKKEHGDNFKYLARDYEGCDGLKMEVKFTPIEEKD
jgi:hypothetical protein